MSEKTAKKIRAVAREKTVDLLRQEIDGQAAFRRAVARDIKMFEAHMHDIEDALQYLHKQMGRVDDIEQGLGLALTRLDDFENRPWWWRFYRLVHRPEEDDHAP